MKYIDADRLRKELDKRLKNVRDYMNGEGMKYKGPKYHKAQGKESSYDALLSIIDSLQQEQPDLPGIEESGIPGKDYIPVDWVDACEMYGKWKIVKVEQPSLPDNLDEAELKYVESLDNPPANQEEERIIYQTFKAGAEWMSKQMNNDKRKDNCSIYH